MARSTSVLVHALGALLATTAISAAQPGVTDPEDQVLPPEQVAAPAPTRPVMLRHSTQQRQGLWGGGVRLTGLSGIGALPGVNMGAEVAVFVRLDERFLELGLGRWVPQETYVVSEEPTHVELGLDVWSLRGGWASRTMPLRAWVLAEIGEVASKREMTGYLARMVGAVEKDHRWAALGAGFGVAWPMSDQARLVGNVELAVPIARHEMMMTTGKPYEPDAAAARCSLGIEVGWR
ncbi:MAG: hypothetical protein ABI175_01470 [Polyangiales bacterium]